MPRHPASFTKPNMAVCCTRNSATVSNGGAGGNGRWTKTTIDGFGRPVKAETGYGTTVVSTVDTEYEPCACSPLGKVKRVSRPYAAGGTVYWTTYAYDALGRTLTVTLPGNMGTTAYLYEGEKVKATDAAGKWKRFTMNALGQIVQVNEPNPAGGAELTAVYTYDAWGNLSGVSMTRGPVTQTRTFHYNADGTLQSSVLPENGTTSYTYNGDKTPASKVDAKGQKTTYSYDAYKRLVQVRRHPDGFTEDTLQRVNHYYDSNPFDGAFTQNGAGRRVAAEYWVKRTRKSNGTAIPGHFVEMYSYTAGGLMTKKRMAIELENAADGSVQSNYAEAQYAYDSEGRRTQMAYPKGRWRDLGSEGQPWIQDPGRTLDYTYDAMGRLHTMAEPYPAVTWVNGVTYNAAGQATQIGGETRTYNIIGQLTRITYGSNFDERYDYHATARTGPRRSPAPLCAHQEESATGGSPGRRTCCRAKRCCTLTTRCSGWLRPSR